MVSPEKVGNVKEGNFHIFLWKQSPKNEGLWKWILTAILLFGKDFLLPKPFKF